MQQYNGDKDRSDVLTEYIYLQWTLLNCDIFSASEVFDILVLYKSYYYYYY